MFGAFKRKVMEADSLNENERYKKWISKNETTANVEEPKIWYSTLQERQLVSFILKGTSDTELFMHTLNSIGNQMYQHWEILTESMDQRLISQSKYADRIRSSNYSDREVNGKWVVPITAGDTLSTNAIAEAFRLLETKSNLDLIYSDHDRIDDSGNRFDPFFKPCWSPEFLQSTPYIGRLAFFKKDLILNSPLFWKDEQTWLKQLSEKNLQAERIPKILYHFRTLPSYDAVKTNASSANLSISILIPTRDQPVKLKCAVNSILEKTTHRDFEIVILNNASKDKATLRYFEECKSNSRIRIFNYDRPFNFSAINNFGVSKVSADYVVFLNDDTELIAPDWLQEMLEFCSRPEIGAVGAK
ncbi:MAG TPA: glycosyltransferase, partial [Acidobacteriota bacterium]|nr:glycosyltransferase [Acidobacteriota bacterium]